MLAQIGGYHIIRCIAESNTAEIFSARPAAAGRRLGGSGASATAGAVLAEAAEGSPPAEVALKVLRPEFAHSRIERRHLQKESQIGRALSHPSLIAVQCAVLDAPRPFLVMERFPGPSLRNRLNTEPNERISPTEVLPHLARLADGLAYMHNRGWAHLDVKPQNILIGQNGQTRLIDMALAERIGHGGRLRRLWRRLRGRTAGTRSYMSPEQIRGRPVDEYADIYSLGVTLFEVLAGRLPFVAEDPSEVLAMHLSAPVPQVRWFNPKVNPALDELVQNMLAKQPTDRPRTMTYVSAKLKGLDPLA